MGLVVYVQQMRNECNLRVAMLWGQGQNMKNNAD